MKSLRLLLLALGLVLLAVLATLSVTSAFMGAARAREFFNLPLMAGFWALLLGVIAVSLLLIRRLRRFNGLMAMHLGCVLVLAGAMWGSKLGQKFQHHILKLPLPLQGYMIVPEGGSDNRVVGPDGDILGQLPFSVELRGFWMDYYSPGTLLVEAQDGRRFSVKAEPGTRYVLADDLPTLEIIRTFNNLRIMPGENGNEMVDAPGGANGAVELHVIDSDGSSKRQFAFEKFPGHVHPDDVLRFQYQRMVKDYFSELAIEQNEQHVKTQIIEVNKPLAFGGYHFYQHDYDHEGNLYTVLGVAPDTGLDAVYAGFALIGIGSCWWCWRKKLGKIAKKGDANGN